MSNDEYCSHICVYYSRTGEFESLDANHAKTGPEETLTRFEQVAESKEILCEICWKIIVRLWTLLNQLWEFSLL